MNRRQLIQGVALVAATSPLQSLATIVESVASRGARLGAAIVDAEDPGAAVFGEAFAQRGVPIHRVGHDLTDVYTRVLRPAWRAGATFAVAGMTAPAALFYLERLGWDAGMRLVLIGRHADEAAPHTHEIVGPVVARDTFAHEVCSKDWPQAAACAVLAVPERARGLPGLVHTADAAIRSHRTLVSWLLAPRTAKVFE
ncbi:MAG: hypothetical protein ABI885_11500 [Gammaproteobacteria bacterium]